jgi:predicted amidophosphoribosyltransferase
MIDKPVNERQRQKRLDRERRTIHLMIEIYCRGHHETLKLCPNCVELLAYAIERIGKCTFRAQKPACSTCSVHCYKPAMRERVRHVMSYAGPRMLIYHPILTIRHYVDSLNTSWRR